MYSPVLGAVKEFQIDVLALISQWLCAWATDFLSRITFWLLRSFRDFGALVFS
ncbi:hypothetical protein O9992_24960 [Vibrio lentus]|nr:hypothetical protein [Vibrio lentus]